MSPRLHPCISATFILLRGGGQSITLDLTPPPGQALGLAVDGQTVYYHRDVTRPVTEGDRTRWREVLGEEWSG